MTAKRKGVLLILGGAPDTPHVIEGLPGYFSPSAPRLVGDDFPLELARQAVKDHSDIFEFVDVSASKVEAAEAAHAEYLQEGRAAMPGARRDGRAKDDPSRTEDEQEALKEGN